MKQSATALRQPFGAPLIVPALFGLALLLAAPAARSETFNIADIVQATVLPGWQTTGGTRMAALRLTLAPGWKTYWRVPGEAGIPAQFDISASTNIAGMVAHWPTPQVFDLAGLQSFGFAGELVLPLEFTPRAGGAMALVAEINLGVCDQICVPVMLNLTADLSGAGVQDAAIAAALLKQPATATKAGLKALSCALEPTADGLRLTADLELPSTGETEVGVVELSDPAIWISPAQTTRSGGTLRLVADLVPPQGAPLALDRSGVRLTVLGSGRAVEVLGCPAG